jgi:Phosphorylase superfamily
VMQQLIGELQSAVVISTGTAGAIGGNLNCGDVAVTSAARFHVHTSYPGQPQINRMSADQTELANSFTVDTEYLDYAAANLTRLSMPGLSQCYSRLQSLSGYSFVRPNTAPPAIYVTGSNPVPGPEPMAVVSADYLTVDDNHDSEGLQPLGIMNETDDAFLFYAIDQLAGTKPEWLSVRNASEPQIIVPPFPPGTPKQHIINTLKGIAGSIYGIYQYCTTLNSALACWGIIAGL